MTDSAKPFIESDYPYHEGNVPHTMRYLLPAVRKNLPATLKGVRILDVGCGDGYLASRLKHDGADMVGIDLGERGIEAARRQYPGIRFESIGADDQVLQKLDCEPFDYVVSTEVVEHLYDPRSYARGCFAALKPGGVFVCSTPYHGWLKNVAVTMTNHFDKHFDPLWEGGHIKFWTRNTLGRLLTETGFRDIGFTGAGRLPYLWMSMVMTGRRP